MGLAGAHSHRLDCLAGLWRAHRTAAIVQPDRVAEAADLLADWVGLLLGAGLAFLLDKNFSGEST